MVWNAGIGPGIAAHLRALGPYGEQIAGVLPGELEHYAAGWAMAHRGACRAHERGELTPELYAANLGCLSRARVALATTSEVLRAATVERLPDAVVAARGLPMVDGCRVEAETSTAAPPPHVIATRVGEVGADVVRARTLALAVDPRALELAARADRDAVQLAYPALVGKAALVHGFALMLAHRRDEAIVVFDRASAAALEARDSATAIEAIARKLFAVAVDTRSRGTTEGHADTPATIALAEPLALGMRPTGGFARALLFNNVGTVRLAQQDTAGARVWFEKALRERPAGTADGIELASIVGNLGLVETDRVKRDALFQREGDELEAVLGRDHPLALDARLRAAMFIEHPGRARTQLANVCERYRRLHPTAVERAAQCIYEIAWLAEESGDVAGGAAELGTIDPTRIEARVAVGYQLLLGGKVAEANRTMLEVGAALAQEKHFWARWRGVDALIVAAIAQHALGDLALERTTLERALAAITTIEAIKTTTFYQRRLARIHRMLARIAPSLADHATAALTWYRAAGGYDAAVTELEALTLRR
ncbi:MAG: hypothetical protein ABI175_27295, partial [Polyangiales bacterium]